MQKPKSNKAGTIKVPTGKNITLRQWAIYWVEVLKKNQISPNTYNNYKGYINNHIIPDLGHHKLRALTPDHISTYYKKKLESENISSGTTLEQIRFILNSCMNSAVREKLCNENPVDGVPILMARRKPKRKGQQKSDLAKIAKEATDHGMTYGKYVAWVGNKKIKEK